MSTVYKICIPSLFMLIVILFPQFAFADQGSALSNALQAMFFFLGVNSLVAVVCSVLFYYSFLNKLRKKKKASALLVSLFSLLTIVLAFFYDYIEHIASEWLPHLWDPLLKESLAILILAFLGSLMGFLISPLKNSTSVDPCTYLHGSKSLIKLHE